MGGSVTKFVFHLFGKFISVRFARRASHADSAERIDAAHQRRARLKPDDELQILIDICRWIVKQRRHRFGINTENAAFFALFFQKRIQFAVQFLRALGRSAQKAFVAAIRRIIFLNKIPDIGLFLPNPAFKSVPSIHFIILLYKSKGQFRKFETAQTVGFTSLRSLAVNRFFRQSRKDFFIYGFIVTPNALFVNRFFKRFSF